MKKTEKFIAIAKKAASLAYAPYSHFAVGAALLGSDKQVYLGCNIECGVPIGICAERSALVCAVSTGCRSFKELFLYTDTTFHITPCGVCRQMLFEFAKNLKITSINNLNELKTYNLRDLLPNPFDVVEAGAYSG